MRRTAVWMTSALLVGCYHVAQLAHLVHRGGDARAPHVYAERCSGCHGDAGRGDGLAGGTLDPRPRDFADAGWQASTSDDRIRFVIRHGGRAAGLSALMSPHGDLTDEQLDALVAYIRSIGRS